MLNIRRKNRRIKYAVSLSRQKYSTDIPISLSKDFFYLFEQSIAQRILKTPMNSFRVQTNPDRTVSITISYGYYFEKMRPIILENDIVAS